MRPTSARTGARRLGLAILLAPLAWLAYLQIGYALVPIACRHPGVLSHLGLYASAVIALGLALLAIVLAWPGWRATADTTADDAPPAGRARFMALTALGSGALFALVAIGGIVPLLMLTPCE